MSLYARLAGKGPSGFGYGSTAREVVAGLDLSEKTYLITGTTSGLGNQSVRALAERGARILATGRTQEKVSKHLGDLGAAIVPLSCELSDPGSVRACVRRVRELGHPLDGILCNAGVMSLPRLELACGYEMQFFTNHIGHFLLVTGLLDQLSEQGRVVVVSSAAHRTAPIAGIDFDNLRGERGYNPWQAYGRSKLANILFVKELARRLPPGQTANALHPGVIDTPLVRHLPKLIQAASAVGAVLFMKNPEQGAATSVYLTAHPDAASHSGEYFADCNLARCTRKARDAELARKLWQRSEEIAAQL